MNSLIWHHKAWADYLYWQKLDRDILKKINALIKDTSRNPFKGIGKPEALKGEFKGYWSRRITKEHRLIYKATDEGLIIIACRFHYS